MDGILPVDKPTGITSHDVVDILRRILPGPKIGHGGTLDPMATGLLLLLVGSATKRSEQLLGLDKSYLATVTLGMTTDTWDLEGKVLKRTAVPALKLEQVNGVCEQFRGEIEQKIPAYSAVRFKGKRGYELARAGKEVPERLRRVRIDMLKILKFSKDQLELEVTCSKGTYIRSLAHELGEALGCGGTLTALRRVRIGDWSIDQAHRLDDLKEAPASEVAEFLQSPVSA